MRGARRTAVVAAIAFALVALLPAANTAASEITSDEFRRLAEQARTDPDAFERLAGVERVDGQPVDVERLLGGAEGEERDARLRTLARDVPATEADAEVVRLEAREILQEPRFAPTDVPRPFRGLLEQVADGLQRASQELFTRLPGEGATPWIIGIVAAIIAALIVASLLAHRRGAEHAHRRARPFTGARSEDPRALEREAAEAERAGDLARAVRLRFQAGLIRLETQGLIERRLTLTTGELSRRLRSESFEEVARSFEEIVYGGRSADPEDARVSREGWSRVLEGAGRR